MDIDGGYFKKFGVRRPLSERADLIAQFVEKINQCRKGTRFKDVTPRAVAIKVGHLNTKELREFLRSCETAKVPFGQAFFGCLKVKK